MNYMEERITRLIGPITHEQAKLVAVYPSDSLVLCVPIAGQCQFATSPAHSHPSVMALVMSDRQDLKGEGLPEWPPLEQSRDSTGYQLRILPPNVVHQEDTIDSPDQFPRYHAVMIDPSQFVTRDSRFLDRIAEFPWKPLRASPRLLFLLREMVSTGSILSCPLIEEQMNAVSILIIHELIGIVNGGGVGSEGSQEIVHRAIDIMERRYSESLTVESIARESCTSKATLFRLFHSQMNTTPLRHLEHLRIQRAKAFLASGESVKTSADRTGFISATHFARKFRESVGVSPSEFRKNSRL